MTYATEAVLRRSRTNDGRPAHERIAQLEAEVLALRQELARMREEKGETK
jgi:hypothetical protein